MQISKRNGTTEAYGADKIKRAMGAAFASVGSVLADDEADRLVAGIERAMADVAVNGAVAVEDVQDLVERALMEANHYQELKSNLVERALMEANHYQELKSYILYREDRARKRAARERCAR
ncbi:ATP cone domain-containing protein, partial [Eggerthella sinensis]|uniref:ATP cone domain-containing protein n=1 Tax=Eggerthella sinensis TaxID=242230 RepID=UPI0022DFC45C